jgi:hypothetical protein
LVGWICGTDAVSICTVISMKNAIINLGLFKAGWMAVVLLAAAGMPVAGALAALAVVVAHLVQSADYKVEFAVVAVSAVIGFVWESILVVTGVLDYGSAALLPGTAPFWIVSMWMLFATTLNVGMRWLRKSTLLAGLAGLVGGPAAFLAGQGAGAVTLADPVNSLLVIGCGWAVLLPALVAVAERLDGQELSTQNAAA